MIKIEFTYDEVQDLIFSLRFRICDDSIKKEYRIKYSMLELKLQEELRLMMKHLNDHDEEPKGLTS